MDLPQFIPSLKPVLANCFKFLLIYGCLLLTISVFFSMAQEMQTFDARLVSFDLVLHPDKRGSSANKSSKPITWPHSRPSPAEVF